jgi:hypothetical protein
MLKVLARAAGLSMIVVIATSCGEEDPPSPRAQRCERISGAACATFVRCRAIASNGQVFSDQLCAQALPQVTANCVSNPSTAAVETASDAEINACVSAFQEFPCSEICGRLAVDPPACQHLDTAPSQNTVQCAP